MITAEIKLWGTTIGTLMQNKGEYPCFQYTPEFLASGIQLSPLMMPLTEKIYSFPELTGESFNNLPGLLADSLPDRFGTALWEKYQFLLGKSLPKPSVIEKLLYLGKRGMGALEFYPANETDITAAEKIKINDLVYFTEEIINNQDEKLAAAESPLLKQVISSGISAGGSHPKAVIAWNRIKNEFCSAQGDIPEGFEHYLVKYDTATEFANSQLNSYNTKIEYACYLMALAAGINISLSALYTEENRTHFLTKRFDRDGNKKLHRQSIGAIAHWDYQKSGEYSYEQAADVLQKIGLGQKEINKFYKQMVFNVLTNNYDDHVKNFSCLMDRNGKWTLAPAYDLTIVASLNGHELTIQGKRKNITIDDLKMAARYMNISKGTAKNIIEEVTEAIKKWSYFAEKAELRKTEKQFIENIINANCNNKI